MQKKGLNAIRFPWWEWVPFIRKDFVSSEDQQGLNQKGGKNEEEGSRPNNR